MTDQFWSMFVAGFALGVLVAVVVMAWISVWLNKSDLSTITSEDTVW